MEKKKDLINYLVDVLGHNIEEARKIVYLQGVDYLDREQLEEFKEFSQPVINTISKEALAGRMGIPFIKM